MYSLGFSFGHDRGAVIIQDDKILVGINDERLARIKGVGAYSNDFPELSIKYCLEYLGLTFSDIDLYVYTYSTFVPDVRERFKIFTGLDNFNLEFIPHHLAHAYCTFYSSGFNSAAVVVADAMGTTLDNDDMRQWYPNVDTSSGPLCESYAIYQFNLNGFTEVYKKWMRYPPQDGLSTEEVSIGLSYAIGSHQLVYDAKTHSWSAGKLMGLASYAKENFHTEINKKLKLQELDMKIMGGRIEPSITHLSGFAEKANIAGVYQRIQEISSLHLVGMAKKLTNETNLCVAGGSFLNCNTNELILKSTMYENYYFIPGSDDSGIPLGCAWYGTSKLKSLIIPPKQLSAYVGKKYSNDDVLTTIQNYSNLQYQYYHNIDDLAEYVAQLLKENKVVGWMQNGSELGPRALGNRSILASPTEPWMVNYINAEVKNREWYRPFAPSVLFEYQSEIFDIKEFSPYMLITTQVKDSWKPRIPAVTHIDGTSRIQSVTKESNYPYYLLINYFYNKTGIPLVLNTSFNGKDEPIVETPDDAINCFLNTKLQGLVINNFFIYK